MDGEEDDQNETLENVGMFIGCVLLLLAFPWILMLFIMYLDWVGSVLA